VICGGGVDLGVRLKFTTVWLPFVGEKVVEFEE